MRALLYTTEMRSHMNLGWIGLRLRAKKGDSVATAPTPGTSYDTDNNQHKSNAGVKIRHSRLWPRPRAAAKGPGYLLRNFCTVQWTWWTILIWVGYVYLGIYLPTGYRHIRFGTGPATWASRCELSGEEAAWLKTVGPRRERANMFLMTQMAYSWTKLIRHRWSFNVWDDRWSLWCTGGEHLTVLVPRRLAIKRPPTFLTSTFFCLFHNPQKMVGTPTWVMDQGRIQDF